MKVNQLIASVSIQQSHLPKPEQRIGQIRRDSREVEDSDVFVAIVGAQFDGHDYVGKLELKKLALVVLSDQSIYQKAVQTEVNVILVENTKEALACLASEFYGHPSKKLKVIGVTGTNGKSSTVLLLHQMATRMGIKSGVLSTLYMHNGKQQLPTINTTPDSLTIQRLLQQTVNHQCEYVFMEVSSHGIHQKRILGITFYMAVFTNITHDHLDYHPTFKSYLYCKKELFDNLPKEAYALINIDDKNGAIVGQNCTAQKKSMGIRKTGADFNLKVMENQLSGLVLKVDGQEVSCLLSGEYNAYNLLTTYAVANLLEWGDTSQLLLQLSALKPVRGRFERVENQKGIHLIIDYAHTPDALESLLSTIQKQIKKEKITTIVGCGGDRDKAKRPLMAFIAEKYSDRVILTSDNPRTENPAVILQEMKTGLAKPNKSFVLTDRGQAIRLGVQLTCSGDVLVIAGKGHETYQEIMGVKHPFDDRQVALETINENN